MGTSKDQMLEENNGWCICKGKLKMEVYIAERNFQLISVLIMFVKIFLSKIKKKKKCVKIIQV